MSKYFILGYLLLWMILGRQVGDVIVCSVTYCTTIHGDGEYNVINATKVTHDQCEHCVAIVLLSSKPLEPLLEANLVAKGKRKKRVKGWEVN